MTKTISNTPLWPYIGVVSCLLMLAVLSPRSWTEDRDKPVAPQSALSQPTLAAAEVVGPDSEVIPQPPLDADAGDFPRPGSLATSPAARQATTNPLLSLDEFQTPRQLARIAPPVTERIDFDPSLDHAPSLPAPEMRNTSPRVMIAPRLTPPPVSPNNVNVSVSKKRAETAPHVATFWPMPRDLIVRIEEVSKIEGCKAWADQVRFTIVQLHRSESPHSSAVTEYLDLLDAAVQKATALVEQQQRPAARSAILRTNYALARRIEIWKQIRRVVQGQTVPVSLRHDDDVQIARRLDAIEEQLADKEQGAAWGEYLRLSQLRNLIGSGQTKSQHEIARSILSRMDSDDLSTQQTAMLKASPFSELAFALRRWADEPIDCTALLDDIEAYEETRRVDGARSLARLYQNSRWSTNPEIEKLSDLLNSHYRNANIRVAIAGELLNRLIPVVDPADEDINEYIQGTRVYGVSRVHTKLSATLVPDNVRWRVGVEASGEVESSTAANAGPATFYNEALSRYLARKLLIVERHGVRVWRAEAEADSNSGLTGFRTDYDRVPILGWLARSIALDQHDSRIHIARREAEEHLASVVSERLDREVHQRVEEAERDFNVKMYAPMKALRLEPIAVDLHTTKTRLIGRYRLAGANQLGAHTPRPQAPNDSLLSVQIHESALNNVIEQIKLEGKESDLRELYREIGALFARPDLEAPDDVPTGVTVRFDDSEPVRVRFEQGRVIITLRIAELSRGWRYKWKNFAVRAYYVPDPTQLDANLVREGSIELDGRHITSGDRIVLGGIFSKTLSRSQPFNLINKRIAESDELQDLQVTQFVVTSGWIGVALGPQFGAEVHRLATPPNRTPIR